jgi:hypothetical protein
LDADVVTSDGTTYHGLLIPGRVPNYGSWLPYPNRNTPSCISYCYGVYRESSTDSWKVYDGSFEAGHEKVRTTRIPNWPKFDIEKPWIQLLFILVAFLYGGLHSLAWNSLFPSQKEQLLWRISTTIMGAGVPALICYLLSQRTSNPKLTFIPHYAPRWRIYAYRLSKPILNQRLACILRIPRERVLAELEHEGRISPPPIIWDGLPLLYKSIDKFLVFIIISLLPAYLFARVYLVVESFIQLFHLESGPAFEQPHWSTYIPHLG